MIFMSLSVHNVTCPTQPAEIRSWWEVPCIAHFCYIFRKPFKLPEFEIEVCSSLCALSSYWPYLCTLVYTVYTHTHALCVVCSVLKGVSVLFNMAS